MNKQVVLSERPDGLPKSSTWTFQETGIPEPKDGDVLIKQPYISLDPAMRGWIRDVKLYIPPVAIRDIMRAGIFGKIVKANNHRKFKLGDFIFGWGGIQQYTITNGKDYCKIVHNKATLLKFLSITGMLGTTPLTLEY